MKDIGKDKNKMIIICLALIAIILVVIGMILLNDKEQGKEVLEKETQEMIEERYENYENEDLSLGMYASSESELFDMSSISLDSDTKEKKVRISFVVQTKVDITESQTVILSFYNEKKEIVETISFLLKPKNSGENEIIELESNNLDLMISKEVDFVVK